MIPPEGRDVQCSNCATTWFQPGRRTERPAVSVSVDRAVEQAADAAPDAAQGDTSSDRPDDIAAPPASDAPATEPDAATRPVRRAIDPEVADILRQEAAREERLRRGAASPVETQSEMSLAEEPDADNRARRRAEREQLDDAQDAFDVADRSHVHHGARRDLLPDIEVINSTLRATGDRSTSEADASDIETLNTGPRRRRGVRIGFIVVLAIAALGAAVYSNADRVAEMLPQAAPWVDQFVTTVNSARFWLDDMARSLAARTG